MSDIAAATWAALPHTIGLSLVVSLAAAAAAAVVGLPLGAALAVYRFRGRAALILLANALLFCHTSPLSAWLVAGDQPS